jgi:hypothetical protein
MKYTLKVDDSDLKSFLKSIIIHSRRGLVKGWLKQMGLGWKKFWDVQAGARTHLIKALIWAEEFPTPKQVLDILDIEKFVGPRNTLLNYSSVWWMNDTGMDAVMREAYEAMTADQFLKIVKINYYRVLSECKKEFLPLAMTLKTIANHHGAMHIITQRLKDESHNPTT